MKRFLIAYTHSLKVHFTKEKWFLPCFDRASFESYIKHLTALCNRNNLGAKVIILKDRGHFLADDGVTEVPEILEEITSY